MSLQIRTGLPEDAPTVARVHQESRQAAYGRMIPEHLLQGFDDEERVRRWRAWLSDPECVTLLGERDGELVGFCTIGPSRDPDADETTVAEMPTLYVAPGRWGRGFGRALCAEACRRAADLGFRALTLWVLDPNTRAKRFYEAFGFVADGATKMDDGPIPSSLLARRYRLELRRWPGGWG